VRFVVGAVDRAHLRRPDLFRIRLGNGYRKAGRLVSGNVRVGRAHETVAMG
jgi:hypothetical protein